MGGQERGSDRSGGSYPAIDLDQPANHGQGFVEGPVGRLNDGVNDVVQFVQRLKLKVSRQRLVDHEPRIEYQSQQKFGLTARPRPLKRFHREAPLSNREFELRI